MNSIVFKGFRFIRNVDDKIINDYDKLIPIELLEVWKKYGFGTILNGYLKLVNPDEYKLLLNNSYFRGNISVPIFVTAFGDIITWEENKYVRLVKYKEGKFDGISSGFEFFWEDISTKYFCDKFFELDKYNEALKRLGDLEYDECFGYVPLLGLGGGEKVENLKKVKTIEHIELITKLVGKID